MARHRGSRHSSYKKALICARKRTQRTLKEFEAETLLLQAQLEHAQSDDDLTEAIGETPQ